MAVAELEREKKNEESETNGNTQAPVAASAGFGSKTAVCSQAASELVPVSSSRTVTVEEGFEWLQLLVAEEVWKRGPEVSKAIIDKAIEGNPTALKVVQQVLERPRNAQKPEEPARQGRTLAEIWAAEPRWGESSEETAEVGAGGREPER